MITDSGWLLWALLSAAFAALTKARLNNGSPSGPSAQVFGMDMHIDGWEMMSRVQVPTLLMRGAESDKLSAKDADELVRLLRFGATRASSASLAFGPETSKKRCTSNHQRET